MSRRTNRNGTRIDAPGIQLKEMPAAGTSGQLRITRSGPEIVLFAAEPPENGFKELNRCPLGTEDVGMLRPGTYQSKVGNAVDIRLVDLRIRSIPASPQNAKQTSRKALWVMIGIIAIGLVLPIFFLWRSRKRQAVTIADKPPES
jgi:hypothetical protein